MSRYRKNIGEIKFIVNFLKFNFKKCFKMSLSTLQYYRFLWTGKTNSSARKKLLHFSAALQLALTKLENYIGPGTIDQ
jgi:hypothetical protein